MSTRTTTYYLLLFAMALFVPFNSSARTNIDSLKLVLESAPQDSNRVNTLLDLGAAYQFTFDESLPYFEQAQQLSANLGHTELEAYSYKMIGVVHYYVSDYQQCLVYWEKSLALYEKENRLQDVANTHNNIGNVYLNLSKYPDALAEYQKCLKTSEQLGNKKSVAASYGNIGNVYEKLGDLDKALVYHFSSFEIDSIIENKNGMAITLNNIGAICEMKGSLDSALYYLNQSLVLYIEANDQLGISAVYENMGNIHLKREEYDEALNFHQQSLEIDKKFGNKTGVAISLNGLGRVYQLKGNLKKAEESQLAALQMAYEVKSPAMKKNVHGSLYEIYSETGEESEALKHHRQYVHLKDSLFNEENTRALMRNELDYEYYKRNLTDSLNRTLLAVETKLKHEAELADERLSTKVAIIVGAGVFVVMALIAIAIFISYRNKSRANLIITQQKQELEEKNNEITDSIHYAKHIQEVIFPTPDIIRKRFPESFILFKPRDIVSGDFYWMNTVGDKTILAVVDCTGHGVPGAFISLLGYTGLRQAVLEQQLTDPAKILESMNLMVNETLKQSYEKSSVRDGMDMTVCTIDHSNNTLEFAGANNPLYVVKDDKLQVIKGDGQSVGGFLDLTAPTFTKHNISLEPGTSIYMFTDGYPDQFGGSKGKKFKYTRFRELISAAASKTMSEQYTLLDKAIVQWQGDLEQVDDICVMGVRF